MTPTEAATQTKSQLFAWSEQTWNYLDQVGILLGNIGFVIAIAGAVWGIIRRDRVRAFFTRNKFPNTGREVDDCLHRPGMIFTISKPDLPKWVVEKSQAQHIGLVATAQSRKVASELKTLWEQQGKTVYGPVEIRNPDSPADTRHAVMHLLALMSAAGIEQVAVDLTGGKVPMSLGAFMAAEEAGVTTLYVTAEYSHELNKVDMRTANIISISEPQ